MIHIVSLLLTITHVILAFLLAGIGTFLGIFKLKNHTELTGYVMIIGGAYMVVGSILFPTFAILSFAIFWPVYVITLYFIHLNAKR